MMPTVCLGKLYGYERTYNKVYIVCLDNGQIVCIRDVRFYKEDLFVGKVDEKTLSKTVFDKETKRLVLKEIIFGSNDRLPLSQTSKPS